MTGPWETLIVKGRNWRSTWKEIVILLLLVVVIGYSVATCQYRKKGVGEKSQATIDSLATTKPAFDAEKLASRKTEAGHVATGEVHRATVTRSTAGAKREGISADSLARLALAAVNEAKAWRAAYEARTRERDSLLVALAAANARADSERLARQEADRRAALDSARNVALQKLALGLEKDANKAANCRVAYVIPCATRTQTAIAGVIVGAAGVYALTSRRP